MKITDYIIVQEVYDAQMERSVNDHIKDGWQPLGGISVIENEDGDKVYYQAMVKREGIDFTQLK